MTTSLGAGTARTAGTLVAAASEQLRRAGSPSPRLDAELLVSHAFGRDRSWLLAHPDAELAGPEIASLLTWLQRRSAGEPIAYIRGFKDWFSLRIATDRRALIPRPETELLAELAVTEIARRLTRDQEPVAAWEVATGSGAVSVALATRFKTALQLGRLRLAASDASPEAVELAAENLAAHGLSGLVTLACGDLLEPDVLPPPTRPDVLVANLPYLTSDEAAAGVGSLRFEPRAALDGGTDGLALVRRLLAALPDGLAPGGTALLELGAGQAEPVREAVEELAMGAAATFHPDLAGIHRVARIDRP